MCLFNGCVCIGDDTIVEILTRAPINAAGMAQFKAYVYNVEPRNNLVSLSDARDIAKRKRQTKQELKISILVQEKYDADRAAAAAAVAAAAPPAPVAPAAAAPAAAAPPAAAAAAPAAAAAAAAAPAAAAAAPAAPAAAAAAAAADNGVSPDIPIPPHSTQQDVLLSPIRESSTESPGRVHEQSSMMSLSLSPDSGQVSVTGLLNKLFDKSAITLPAAKYYVGRKRKLLTIVQSLATILQEWKEDAVFEQEINNDSVMLAQETAIDGVLLDYFRERFDTSTHVSELPENLSYSSAFISDPQDMDVSQEATRVLNDVSLNLLHCFFEN
jgi:hypothetical protein